MNTDYFYHFLLLRCCLTSLIVMLVTWFCVWCLRHQSAATRHRVFALGLAGVVLLPAVVLLTQNRNTTIVLPYAWPTVVEKTMVAQTSETSDTAELTQATNETFDHNFADAATEPVDAVHSQRNNSIETAAGNKLSQPIDFNAKTSNRGNQVAQVVVENETVSGAIIGWGTLPLLWATVAILLILRACLDRVLLQRIIQRSIPVTDERTQAFERSIAKQHHIRDAKLLCSELLQVPVAIGIVRPTIVLPTGYGKWSDDRLRVVLLHEMIHIGRADVLAQSIARLACMLFWFNPMVWCAASRMRLERELASDDSVLLSGEDAVDYADHLVEIASAISHRLRLPASASAMATHTNLQSRVSRLMQRDIDRQQLSRRASFVLLLIACVTLVALTVATPSVAMTPDESIMSESSVNNDPTQFTLTGDLPADWFEQLEQMPELKTLIIRHPGKNFQASQLSKLNGIETLRAEGLRLQSSMADVIMINTGLIPSLRTIVFRGTGLTSRGLRGLANSSVVTLRLIDEERLTDDGFEPVGQMKSLEELELNGTPIEADGLRHLVACPKLKRFSLLKDLGASERIPVIAAMPHLEELALYRENYSKLVELKDAKSLRQLTLHNCGAFNPTDHLGRLTQVKKLLLNNADLRDERFEDVRRNLAKLGIEVVDITKQLGITVPGSKTEANAATLLARRVHQELDYAKHHPSLWIKSTSEHGNIAAMKSERVRTVNLLKNAMTKESAPKPGNWNGKESIIAWSPGQYFEGQRHWKDEDLQYAAFKYGGAKLAWARERYETKNVIQQFLRNGMKEFADELYHIPTQLKVSHQSYWWGKGLHHRVATSSVSPESATYQELATEHFGDEQCRVLESPGRSERLWVSAKTGRLRGVLTFIHQGYRTPFYNQPIVTKIVGREVKSSEEYRLLFDKQGWEPNARPAGSKTLSAEKQAQLTQAWSEYMFETAIPHSLHLFNDYREIAPQRWFSFEVRSSGVHHSDKSDQLYSYYNNVTTVMEVATDRVDLKSRWTPLLPKEGEVVQDQRFDVPVEYAHRKTTTNAEIQELVRAQLFKYAESQMLLSERRGPIKKLVNKPAKDLSELRWIGEQPDLKGKSYLLHFWANWCGPCKNDVPLLNSLAKNSIVIGVHPSGTDVDEIKQSMAESGMKYPTVVAVPKSKEPAGYPVTMYPYCVKVDEKGNVVKHGSVDDVLATTHEVVPDAVVNDQPKISGIVQSIKPDTGLVQVTVGTEDGIELNQMMNVYRNGEFVGRMRVVLAKDNMSVGKVIRGGNEIIKILKGDSAQTP